jgi:hypothetical protein
MRPRRSARGRLLARSYAFAVTTIHRSTNMTTLVFLHAIRRDKRRARMRRARRRLAYHLDYGVHGQAAYEAPGWYRWFPHPLHRGYLVEAAALVLGPEPEPPRRR